MNYKLINKQTKEEHICQKVTIDGFDYYVSDEKYIEDELLYCIANGWLQKARVEHLVEQRGEHNQWKKLMATTNPNIDIPKVIDEVKVLVNLHKVNISEDWSKASFIKGYNKSQETHPFSENNVEFFVKKTLEDAKKSVCWSDEYYKHLTKELLQIWKKQKPKIVYYGND